MVRLLLLWTLTLWGAGPEGEIRKVIEEQAAAWNRGDIEGFMRSYEASAETTYAGSGGVTKGYDKVLARYKAKYTSKAAMGKLQFTDLEVRMLTEGFAAVTGQFHLERTKEGGGNATGWFTLIVKKAARGWKIIHDHTS